MLTDNQAAILRFVHDSESDVFFDDLADRFGRPDSVDRIHHLITARLLIRGLGYADILSLSPAGLAALDEYDSELDRQREQDAKEQEKARTDALKDEAKEKKSFRRELLIAVVSSLITLAVEHCMELLDFVSELVNRLLSLLH